MPTTTLTTEEKVTINQIITALRDHAWRARYETLAFDPERVKGGLPPTPVFKYFYLLIGTQHFKGPLFQAVMQDLKKDYLICSRCIESHQPSLVRRTDIHFACATRESCTFREVMDDESNLYRKNQAKYILNDVWSEPHREIGTVLLDALV